MTASTAFTEPTFTDEEMRRLQSMLVGALLIPDEPTWLTVPIYGWAHGCWKCEVPSYVWMEILLGGPDITRTCEREDVRQELMRANRTPHALIGQVTTQAAGSYRGFTCPWCHAVQGKHFLRLELFRRLVDGEPVDIHHFSDHDGTIVPRQDIPALQGTVFPATRARQFEEWRRQVDRTLAYRVKHRRYPSKRDDEFFHRIRSNARQGTLAAERRAYLDVNAPDWLPTTVPVSTAYADRIDAIAAHLDVTGGFPVVSSKDPNERRLANWLLGQRTRAALGRIKQWEADLLNASIPNWRTADVPDWYGNVLRLAESGIHTEQPDLVAFLQSERARFFAPTPYDDDRTRILDAAIPGWEEGPGFQEWLEREAAYCRGVLDDGIEVGRDMIHDHFGGNRRLTAFFTRIDRRYNAGRIRDEELEWLCSVFETLEGFLHLR